MSARVDVLAELARVSVELSGTAISAGRLPMRQHRNNLAVWADDLRFVRIAVAALIEADREYDAARTESVCTTTTRYDAQWPRIVAAKARRAEALARLGGPA